MTKIVTSIQRIQDEANGVKTFTFVKPPGFEFEPGQYCWISLPKEHYAPAPMAIASGNTDDTLDFSIRAWGGLSRAMFETKVGDSVELDGPHGTAFPVSMVQDDITVHMIAGGTGITPVRSLNRSLGNGSDKVVYYGAKNPSELLYQEEIVTWSGKVILTVDESDENWKGNVGLVTNLLENVEFEASDLFFVCGPKPMEAAVVDYLRGRDIVEENIFVSLEKFDDHGKVVGPVLPVTDNQVEF